MLSRDETGIPTGSHAFTSRGEAQARALTQRAGAGQPLPEPLRRQAQARYGIDASSVRVHDDAGAARLARTLGANALTAGRDIYFAQGRYAPCSAEGERLLAHELAHVAQQQGAPRAVQCDLAQSLPVALGVFEMDMITQAATATSNPGMAGTIAFEPDPHGPYSAEIGLVQAINITDVAGATNPASGMPVDWRQVTDVNTGVPGTEAGRMELMTPGTGSAPAGWYIDTLPSATPRGERIGPNYIEHFSSPPPRNQFGWLRSPTDFGPASLWDFPNFSFDVNFDFETVSKGTDNQSVYGSLYWGFQIRSGAVVGSSEYARAEDSASATFEEALERFRGYYVHEPVVLYFDTNDPFPRAGEEAKLADIPDYLDRYPDVTIQIDGYADVRGSEENNFDLAQQRAEAAANLLTLQGVDAARIDPNFVIGWGETREFSQHGAAPGATQPVTAGRLEANRRVVVSFSHTVSGYPIVMP
jgi:outer membrane protein OmpA-like peptidoglycan-associated protein